MQSEESYTQKQIENLNKLKDIKKRDVAFETNKVTPSSTCKALSSHQALHFNLISPFVLERLATRLTGGSKKYGSVQWRIGINDAEYIADRFNHFYQHLLNFQKEGNEVDDNLGAMLWAIHCLMEVERLAPESFKRIVGVCHLYGESALEVDEQEKSEKNNLSP